MPITDSILNLLDIKDPNLTITDVFEKIIRNTRTKIIQAKLSYQPGRCPNCGFSDSIKYGFKQVSVKLVSLTALACLMHLKKQRFLCHQCETTYFAQSPFLLCFNSSFSKPLCERIIELSFDSLTLKEISKLTGVSTSATNRIAYPARVIQKTPELPENLSFDEFSSRHNQYAFMAINAVTHKLVTLLPARTKMTITNYFWNHYSLEQRQAVKTVTVDMNAAYASFIYQIFPNALVIIDRFHIVQLLQTAFKDTRVATLKRLPNHHSRQYKSLKTHWRLFNKTENQLDAQHIKYYRGLNEFTTQQNIVSLGLEDQPTLTAVYMVYQTLLEALQNRDFKTFETTVHQYQRTNTTMDTAIRTLKKNLNGIQNAMLYLYSNGPIEGLNRKIKTLKRICYGFRNIDHFFTRIERLLA